VCDAGITRITHFFTQSMPGLLDARRIFLAAGSTPLAATGAAGAAFVAAVTLGITARRFLTE
jgi:hypothetical protein